MVGNSVKNSEDKQDRVISTVTQEEFMELAWYKHHSRLTGQGFKPATFKLQAYIPNH